MFGICVFCDVSKLSFAGQESPIVFSDATLDSGLAAPLAGMMGHGGAWGDYDGDGKIDIFVGGFSDRPNAEYKPAPGPVPSRLFRNLGNGRFELAGQPALEFHARISGAVFTDLDNNGTLELYVANNAPRKVRKADEPQTSAMLRHCNLFRNDGGKFVDISEQSGACPPELFSARNIGILDYDGDGLLDLFVVEDKFRGGGKPRSVLLRNLGNLKFEIANTAAGIPDDIHGLGLAVADVNGDGRPDFFAGHSDRLFLSRGRLKGVGGEGADRYREADDPRHTFAFKPLDGEDWPCGAAFGDLNRDGLLDLVISTHHNPARNRVFLNTGLKDGIPGFRDVTKEAGLGDPVPAKCPHVEIQDFDNDGWPDIFMSAAWLEDGKVTPLIYRNEGVRHSVPHFVPLKSIKAPMVYFPAGPSGDYDNDGRLDLFLVNWFPDNQCRLMRNESPKRHWLDVRVIGKTFNHMGIGSQIRIYKAGKSGQADALLGYQEVSTGFGYASGQPAVCHFGLGDEASVDILLRLPNGKTMELRGEAADRVLTVEESAK